MSERERAQKKRAKATKKSSKRANLGTRKKSTQKKSATDQKLSTTLLQDLKEGRWWIALCAVLDLIFFIGFSVALMQTLLKVKAGVEGVYGLLAQELDTSSLDPQNLQVLADNQKYLISQYHQILLAGTLFLLAVLGLWLILQGPNWFLAHRITKSRIKAKFFAKRFISLSVLAAALFALLVVFATKASMLLAGGVLPLVTQEVLNKMMIVIFFVCSYLVTVALATIDENPWIRQAAKRALTEPHLVLTYVLIALGLVLLNWLMMRSLQVHWGLFLVVTALLVLPSYTVARVLFIRATRGAIFK